MMSELPSLKSNILKVFLIVLLATGLYVLFSGKNSPNAQIIKYQEKFFNKGWFYIDETGNKVDIPSLPAKIPVKSGTKSAIYHRLRPFEDGRTSLCFYSQHQNVTVKLNDSVIYTYINRAVPKTLMSYRPVYNFTDLPPTSSNSILCIETDAVVPTCTGVYEEVLLGDTAQVLFSIVLKHINNFLLGIMFIVCAIFLFGTHHLFSHTNKNDRTLFHLALLTLTIGLWQLDDSTLLLFLTGYLPLLWCLKYLTQLFLPFFTFLFVKSIVVKSKTRFMDVFFWVIVAVVFIQYFLQITGLRALTNTIFASHFLYLTICIYTLISLSNQDWIKESKLKYLFLFSMISSILIFAFMAVTLFANKFFSSIMSFGLALTFISMILLAYQKELKVFESVNKADMYKTLAFVDIATGVNNKTAWYTLIDNFNEYTRPLGEYCLIVFDLNNLKKLNDKYGHLIGDKVIKAFCDCLVQVVDGRGALYRIGGDEFVCVLNNMSHEDVNKMLREFDKAVENQDETEHKFSAAYGYQFFTPHSPIDFKNALEQADEKMYNAKVAMKAARE